MGGSAAAAAAAATFGTRLRLLREAAGLSQEELAARAGLTASGVSALERGARRHPYPHTVQALADALHLSAAERAALLAAAPRRAGMAFAHATDAAGWAAVPHPATPLVGRERETAALAALQGAGTGRLLTLVGPGGVGKTRLALHLAHAYQHAVADGVVFVALAPVADPAQVLGAIAAALGLREDDQPLPQLLAGYLRERAALLVLDNCEHVVTAAPQVGALLAACPGLTVLATSRTPLRLQGEQEYPVAPLAVPALDHVPALAAVAASPAVQLFVQRAQAVLPGFALTQANAAALAAICRRLDGLPLALELAAARVKLFPPTALLARLDRALPLLTGGTRDLPDRQQTLRATLDWSYNLLSAAERALFRRLAVFAGGWTEAAAQAICTEDAVAVGAGSVAADVLEGLATLVDQSLVRREAETPAVTGDASQAQVQEPRFGMLETVREYAAEKLAQSGEEDRLRRWHATYFLRQAEAAAPALRGAEQGACADRLERDHDNLRAALGWCVDIAASDAVALGVRLGAALWPFWALRGHASEGRARLTHLLALAGDTAGRASAEPQAGPRDEQSAAGAAVAAHAAALCAAGVLAWIQADLAAAPPLFAESVRLFRLTEDRRGLACALGFRSLTEWWDDASARSCSAESAALFEDLADPWGLALVGVVQAHLAARHRAPTARALSEEALRRLRALGDRWFLAFALHELGDVLTQWVDVAWPRLLLEQSLALYREMGDAGGTATALNRLADVARWQGAYDQAAALYAECVALFRSRGTASGLARALHGQGMVAYHRGDDGRARACLEESLILFWKARHRHGLGWCFEGLAGVAARAGGAGRRRAARLLAADASINDPLQTYPPASRAEWEGIAARAQAHLEEDDWTAAWAEGWALTEEQAVAYALAHED